MSEILVPVEPVNGNILQTICYNLYIFKPFNGSWDKSFYIGSLNLRDEPVNGSWLYTTVYDMYYSYNNTYDGFEVVNGDLWQTLCNIVGINDEAFLNDYDLIVECPINGSWENTYMQYLTLSNGEIPMPIVGEVLEYDYDPNVDNPGDGTSSFEEPINVTGNGSGFVVIVKKVTTTGGAKVLALKLSAGGEGYNVGDIVRIPAGAISGVTVDVDITITIVSDPFGE